MGTERCLARAWGQAAWYPDTPTPWDLYIFMTRRGVGHGQQLPKDLCGAGQGPKPSLLTPSFSDSAPVGVGGYQGATHPGRRRYSAAWHTDLCTRAES